MKIKFNKKKLYIIGFALLGLLLLLYHIWFRFIREKLLRDIPCNLTIPRFLGLCILCFVYMYIIFRIYVPRKSPSVLYVLYTFIHKLYKPFYILDILIRRSNIFKKFFIPTVLKFIAYFKLCNSAHIDFFFFLCNTIPKTILLLVFITDIFYFSKLHYFYFVLWLTLLPLFYTYSVYLLTQYLNDISNYLDKHYGVVILSTEEEEEEFNEKNNNMCFSCFLSDIRMKYNLDGVLDAKIFIYFQVNNLIFEHELLKYTCIETWFARESYIKKHTISRPALWVFEPESDDISKALIGKFRELMPQAYYFQAFIETYNDIVKKRTKFKQYDTYILITYLICWMYILNVSIHTLNINEFMTFINSTWETSTEPFTDIAMSTMIVPSKLLIKMPRRRACVIINNDAMHEELPKSIIEGSSLHHQTYQIMSKNPAKYFEQDVLKLTPRELNEIFYNVNEGTFFLGIIKNNNSNKFIESGDEIHMNVITELKRKNEIPFYIGLGHLTSNKDSHTVKLTDKQYINKTIEDVNKTQCFRPYTQFIAFEKASLVIYDEGTSFVQSTNFKEINIRKIISDAVTSKKQYLECNPIRQPNVMTKEKLQNIALELYQQNIDDMNEKIMDYNVNTKSQTPTKRIDENQLRQAQYDNNIKKQKNAFILRNAPQIYKDAYKIVEELETKNKKQKENNIINKKNNEKQHF